MNTTFFTRRDIFIAGQILSMVLVGCPVGARGQAPAGPLPAAQPQRPSSPDARPQEQSAPAVKPRTSIMGAWTLNPDQSDDARKKMQDARGAGGGRGGVRMGIPGMGGGPWGGSGRRGGGGGSGKDEDRQRREEGLSPAGSLALAGGKKGVEAGGVDG